jgi:hypothetical protein
MLKTLRRRSPLILILSVVSLGIGACGDDDDGGGGGTDPPPNQPPTASITAPAAGSTFEMDSQITFEGTGTDPEDGNLTGDNLSWSSSTDGPFGTGTSLSYDALSVGDHTITLTAFDSNQATGSDDITVTIASPPDQPPTAVIVAPMDGTMFVEGAEVPFLGSGIDPGGPELPASAFVWTSNLDDEIGTGTVFGRSDLSVGNHTITLTVTDPQNLTGTAAVSISITKVGPVVSYASDIQPYFDANCVACHADGTGQAGVNLDSHASVMAGGDNGALVVAGDSNQGLLVPQLESGHQGAPHGTRIVQDLKDWIDAGALDN